VSPPPARGRGSSSSTAPISLTPPPSNASTATCVRSSAPWRPRPGRAATRSTCGPRPSATRC